MPAPPTLTETASTAAEFLRRRLAGCPASAARVGIVLGSGLGAFAQQLEQPVTLDYRDIPYFPAGSVPGHEGRLVAGLIGQTPVLVLQGRVHGYEGFPPEQIVFQVRTLGLLGIRAMVLTNAAGGIRLDLRTGQFVLIADHINLTGLNPAIGTAQASGQARSEAPAKWNRAEGSDALRRTDFGPRFFDMGQAYSPALRALARTAAAELGMELPEGVYIGVPGPSFETPAEIRAFRSWGADLVGMSTVLETIAARQMGIEVLGLSCVTNLAAGVAAAALSHTEVMETGRAVEADLARLLGALVPRVAGHMAAQGSTAE